MPATFADGITISDPTVTIDGISFKCTSRSAVLEAEDETVDISNWCNPKGTRPGATEWTAEIELELTYGPAATVSPGTEVDAGTWNTLHAMRKTRKEIVIAPGSGAAAVDNPVATFDAYIPTIPFITAEVAETASQRFTLTLSPIGDPVFDTGA